MDPQTWRVGQFESRKIIISAFLRVLNVSKIFNFRRYLVFSGKKLFFLVRYPKFECLPPIRLSSFRRYFWPVRLCLMPSIFGRRNGPPTPPRSRDIDPQTGRAGHFRERKIFFIAFLDVLNVYKTFNFRRYLKAFCGKKPRPQV